MQLSTRAEGLVAELARQQGLSELGFNENGHIPIRLDGQMEIAIGYSPANDALFLIGIVDPAPDMDTLAAWDLFSRNTELAERRTRLAIEPTSRALILVRDSYVNDLEYYQFSRMMDQFVIDLEGVMSDAGRSRMTASAAPSPDIADYMIFRP
ncbi:MAG: type III secretion system chaperone [Shinella sp.]|uniref:type III secretion system chaperone n=1 Tax=Shinella sp. TaxID=1870904 RepID=UPI0040355FB5